MRSGRRLLSHWQNWTGLVLVAIFVLVAVAAPVLSPEDPKNPGPIKQIGRSLDRTPHPPSLAAPLGTFPGQMSVYHTLVWGARSALAFGLATAAFTAILGILIGTTSAYFGGFYNDILMRITDAFLAFPLVAGVVFITQMISIFLASAGAYSMLGPGGAVSLVLPEKFPHWMTYLLQVNPLMVAFILFSWTTYARIMNSVVFSILQTGYVQATRALGAGHARIILRHLIPNAIAPMIVLAARDVGGMVLLQATFTFVGLGGNSLWGMLLARGRDWIIGPGGNILAYWWLFLPATLALLLFGIGWNVLGDLLNDVLDPHLR